jgi:OmpA-OmpF porin, OOP family
MRHQRPRLALAAVASLQALLLCGPAVGQTVRMFDEAPSLEQLRSIMVPESHGGLSRRIVLPQANGAAASNPVQPPAVPMPVASATPTAPPPVAEAEATQPEPRAAMPVAFRSTHPPAPRSHRATSAALSSPDNQEAAPGMVGFRINFAFNSDAIPAVYGVFLDRIAALMKEESQVRLRIEGHTDAVGSDAYNLELSQRRALAVAEYLVQRQGIEPNRLSVEGKGKSEPLLANPYDPRNRRVQFVRVD